MRPRQSDRNRNSTRLRKLLTKVPLFNNLPQEVQDKLVAVAIPRHFMAGQVIYLEGEPAEAIFIIENGWVKATRMSRQGREQALRFLHSGGVFGDVAVFSKSSYPGTVIALEEVDLYAIRSEDILRLARKYPDLAMAVTQRMAERVLHYVELIEDLSLRSVEARAARTLLRNAEMKDGRLIIPRQAWTTFDEMAARLGTVRDVLSRALRTLENEGLLKVDRQGIVLLDPDGLARRGDS